MNSKEFLALQAEWYQKLKESGFRDIENKSLCEFTRVSRISRLDVSQRNARFVFYNLARQFLFDYPFRSERDRSVWAFFAEGKRPFTQVKELHISRATYYRILTRLEPIFREYIKGQISYEAQSDDD